MKDSTFSPIFASMYCGLCDIARKHGYALAVHGTMNIDFDLVAIPWTDDACEPFELVEHLAKLIQLLHFYDVEKIDGIYKKDPEIKPHGRLAWLLIIGSGATIDLSIMPKIKRES